MARVKRAVNAHKKRRSTLEAASGYRGQRSRLYRKAKEQLLHSATYPYRDRKARKGDFRQLWITRINAAARANDMTYNRFIQGLRLAGVEVDRKVLADLAVTDAAAFAALVEVATRRGRGRGHRRRRAHSRRPPEPPATGSAQLRTPGSPRPGGSPDGTAAARPGVSLPRARRRCARRWRRRTRSIELFATAEAVDAPRRPARAGRGSRRRDQRAGRRGRCPRP